MREKRTAPRHFPFNQVAERGQIDFRDYQAVLSREMLVERALQLVGGRQMDIAIGNVDRRAVECSVGFKLRPLRGGENLECNVRHTKPMPKRQRGGKAIAPVKRYCGDYATASRCFRFMKLSLRPPRLLFGVTGDGVSLTINGIEHA